VGVRVGTAVGVSVAVGGVVGVGMDAAVGVSVAIGEVVGVGGDVAGGPTSHPAPSPMRSRAPVIVNPIALITFKAAKPGRCQRRSLFSLAHRGQ